ncbi:MAG: type IV pilus assembly protein FimV, partial [Gammaproteobacteria bacterium]
MLRNRAVALILGFIASPLVLALGLGPLQSSSYLNEPFEGRIELLGATARDFDALNVGLADIAQFERAGITLNPLLYQLKFDVESGGADGDYIRITTREPVREPFLTFLIELNWANG